MVGPKLSFAINCVRCWIDSQAKLEAERQERIRRLAESEAKRKELKKQTSSEQTELSSKGSPAAPISMKVGNCLCMAYIQVFLEYRVFACI